MKNYSKLFKWLLLGLIAVSVIILVWGFAVGFESNDGNAVNVLLGWAYVMVALAVAAVIVVGAVIGFKNNPKSLVKIGAGIVAIAVICLIAYLLAPGKPAVGITIDQPSATVLKLTDTVLNLTYFAGALAVIAIIAGEVITTVRNKK